MASVLILRGLTGDLRGQEFAFSHPTNAILGRSRSCTVRLPGDATVSRQHCVIELDEFGAWVQDLGSLNGTLVNGEKISSGCRLSGHEDATMVQPARHALEDGDELRICNNIFAVCLSEVASVNSGHTSGHWQHTLCI